MAFRMNVSRTDDWFVGEAKRLRITIWEDKAKTTLADITGWTFAYDFYADGEVAFSLTSGSGITSNLAESEAAIVVPGAQTEALNDLSNLHHVLRRTDAGNEAVLGVGDVILNDPSEV